MAIDRQETEHRKDYLDADSILLAMAIFALSATVLNSSPYVTIFIAVVVSLTFLYTVVWRWWKVRNVDINVDIIEEPTVRSSKIKVETWPRLDGKKPENLKSDNYELLYFVIQNKSGRKPKKGTEWISSVLFPISLLVSPLRNPGVHLEDCRIWIYFPPDFKIITDLNAELKGREVAAREFPLGSLHRTRAVVKDEEKPPNYDNIYFGKVPILQPSHVRYSPPNHNTTIPASDCLVCPIWVKTPNRKGTDEITVEVGPLNMVKKFMKHLEVTID